MKKKQSRWVISSTGKSRTIEIEKEEASDLSEKVVSEITDFLIAGHCVVLLSPFRRNAGTLKQPKPALKWEEVFSVLSRSQGKSVSRIRHEVGGHYNPYVIQDMLEAKFEEGAIRRQRAGYYFNYFKKGK